MYIYWVKTGVHHAGQYPEVSFLGDWYDTQDIEMADAILRATCSGRHAGRDRGDNFPAQVSGHTDKGLSYQHGICNNFHLLMQR